MNIDKKEFILNNISMLDVLNKYGIKTKRTMFSCPFHGVDKTPSAKAYKNTYFCFSCGQKGDLIQFVEDYFNISFKEAVEKINQDFNLNLTSDYKISKQKLEEIQKQKDLKKYKEIYINKRMIQACNVYITYDRLLKKLEKNINNENWEDNTLAIIYLQDKLYKIDIYMDKLEKERLEL